MESLYTKRKGIILLCNLLPVNYCKSTGQPDGAKYILYYPGKNVGFVTIHNQVKSQYISNSTSSKSQVEGGEEGEEEEAKLWLLYQVLQKLPLRNQVMLGLPFPPGKCSLLHVSWGLPVSSGLVLKWSEAMVEADQIVLG